MLDRPKKSRTNQPKITSFFQRTNITVNQNQSSSLNVSPPIAGHTDSYVEDFAHICYLPMYYQNVRSIPARTDLRSRINHSLYKVLCFTETWFSKDHDSECYFPQKFTVYRFDRQTHGGGVAMLVHEDLKSTQIERISDPDCESICVKIELQPRPLVLYLAYVNDPKRPENQVVLLKHCSLVQQLTLIESESRIAVLGDFNLHDIVWNPNNTETHFLPQNISSHMESPYFQTASEFFQKMQDLSMQDVPIVKCKKRCVKCFGFAIC